MCGLTKLECQVCHAQEHFVFHACEHFIHECKKGGLVKSVVPGNRFQCAGLRWPIDLQVDKTYDLCDKCFVAGQKYFNSSSELETSIKKRKRDFNTAMGVPVENEGDKICSIANASGSSSGQDKTVISKDNNEHLPVAFRELGPLVTAHLIRQYQDYSGPHSLQLRSTGGGGRFLTLWVPRCPICEKPSMTEDHEGIAEIEFEPDTTFWTWLHDNSHQGTPIVQTSLASGFMQKVCEHCVLRESRTRGLVNQSLKSNTHWGHQWLVAIWLQSRGLAGIPFYDHETLNVGIPDHKPPPRRHIMKLMTLSWARATQGLAFGDAATGDTSRAPLIRHPYLFLGFNQWQDLCDPLATKERSELEFHLPIDESSSLFAQSDLTQAVAKVLGRNRTDAHKGVVHEKESQVAAEDPEVVKGTADSEIEEHKKDAQVARDDPENVKGTALNENEEPKDLDDTDPTAIGPFAETQQYTLLKCDTHCGMSEKKIWTLVDNGVIDAFAALRLKLTIRLWCLDKDVPGENQKSIELIPNERKVLRDAHEVLDRIIRYIDDINLQAKSSPPQYPLPMDGWAQRHAHLMPKPWPRAEIVTKAKMVEAMETVSRYLKATGATVAGFADTDLNAMPLEAVCSIRKPYRDLQINPLRPVYIFSTRDALDHAAEKEAANHVQWLRPGKKDDRTATKALAMQFTCIAMPTVYWRKMVRVATVQEAILDRPILTPSQEEVQRREEQAKTYRDIAAALM